jgi:hypothetical protein
MTLTPFGFANVEQFRIRAGSLNGDFRCYDDALAFIPDTREKQRRTLWVDERYLSGKAPEGILTTNLFPYWLGDSL